MWSFNIFSKTDGEIGIVLPENPLDFECRWKCQSCGLDVYGGQEVISMERSITLEWESIGRSIDVAAMEDFINR
jgi:hypothetical protein